MLGTGLVVSAVLTLALTVMQFVRLGPLFLGPWVEPADATALVAVLPVLALVLPASFGLAIALVALELSRGGRRELLAASGVGPTKVAAVPFTIALVMAIATAWLSVCAVPSAFSRLEATLSSLATRAVLHSLPEGRFLDLPGGGVLYAGRRTVLEDGTIRLSDVLVAMPAAGTDTLMVLSAPEARVEHRAVGRCDLALENAHVEWEDGTDAAVERWSVEAGRVEMSVDLGALVTDRRGELPLVLATGSAKLLRAGSDPSATYHLVRRIALPLASLCIMCAACGFFLLPVFRRRALAPVTVIASTVGYHALARGAEEMWRAGMLGPSAAAWLPAALVACAAAVTLAASWRAWSRSQ